MKRRASNDIANRTAFRSASNAVPAPIGGWNTRDSIAAMPMTDATIMDNFFPDSTSVRLRKGATTHKTGFASRVKSLLAYSPVVGANSKLFGCTDSGIFDATTAGAVGASVTTLTAGYGQYLNFKTAAGSYLEFVNGVDNLKLYDGSTWTTVTGVSSPAITGLATTELVHIHNFKRRIWFVQKDSMSAWYLPVDSIAGALTEFPVGQYFKRGGYLMALTTWTVDGGEGQDDYLVFISSEGEVAVFQGTDPNDANLFGIVGVFYIGEPIGRRCFAKFGGDVLLICRQGIFPLTKALQNASIDRTIALSDKIAPSFKESAIAYADNEGWQIIPFPREGAVVVGIPVDVGTQYFQYVMNSITFSWCRFTGWEANCWEIFNGELYGGTNTGVSKFWDGVSDFGNNIVGNCDTSPNYFESRVSNKHVKLVRPVLQTDQQIQIAYGIKTDFGSSADYSVVQLGTSQTSVWDVSNWDQAMWASEPELLHQWASVPVDVGFALSFSLRVSSKTSVVEWFSTDYIYESGGVL